MILKKLEINDINTLTYGKKLKVKYDNIYLDAVSFSTKIGFKSGRIIDKKQLKELMFANICEVYLL